MKYPSSQSSAKTRDGITVKLLRDLSPMFCAGMTAEIQNPCMGATEIRRGRQVITTRWSDIEEVLPHLSNPF
jgi:hypothetical protein